MPKLVSQISSGGSSERSVDGGRQADSHVRNWRIILNSPDESYDIQQAIGVKIGDAHPTNTQVPCISISERADGDSRMVRLVTATYKTTPSENPQQDPNSQAPDVRPAKFSISSSLIEVPATQWRPVMSGLAGGLVPGQGAANVFNFFNPAVPFGNPNDVVGGNLGFAVLPLNPVGDRYDGVTKLVPLINISIEQFDLAPVSRLDDAGKVNSDDILFLGLQIVRFTCMLRNISVRPHVESFGDLTYRGFVRTFEFSIKTHGGWLIDQLVEGFNIINKGLGDANVDEGALNLQHEKGKIKMPRAIEPNLVNKKSRARILISAPEGGDMQRPSALPVALNLDGSPRNVLAADPPVLRQLFLTQSAVPFGDNFRNMGIRIHEIV